MVGNPPVEMDDAIKREMRGDGYSSEEMDHI